MNIDFELIEYLKEKVLALYEESKNIHEMNVANKEGYDIVTDVDLFMEERIISFIKDIFQSKKLY